MAEIDLKDYEHKAQIFEDLIVPKLIAVANSGDGATIHRANELQWFIAAYKAAYKRTNQLADLVTYKEYIYTAELWLKSIAKY